MIKYIRTCPHRIGAHLFGKIFRALRQKSLTGDSPPADFFPFLRQNLRGNPRANLVKTGLRKEFGKGRVRVYVTFDGIPYDGSIVNMGLKNADESIVIL